VLQVGAEPVPGDLLTEVDVDFLVRPFVVEDRDPGVVGGGGAGPGERGDAGQRGDGDRGTGGARAGLAG